MKHAIKTCFVLAGVALAVALGLNLDADPPVGSLGASQTSSAAPDPDDRFDRAGFVGPSTVQAARAPFSGAPRTSARPNTLVQDHAGVPVIGAVVRCLQDGGDWTQLETGNEGTVRLQGDESWLHVSASGLMPRLIRLPEDGSSDSVVRLEAPTSLRVAVLSPAGAPLEGVRLALLPAAPEGVSWQTEAEPALTGFAGLVAERRAQLPHPARNLEAEHLELWQNIEAPVWASMQEQFPRAWLDSDCDPLQLVRATDASGTAAFDHLPAGSGYSLVALGNVRLRAPGGGASTRAVDAPRLDPGAVHELVLETAPAAGFYGWIAPEPRFDPASSARLILRRRQQTLGLDGQPATAWRTDSSVALSPNRSFLVEGLEPGEYLLSACWGSNLQGQRVATRRFRLRADELLDLGPVEAESGAPLAGRVEFVDSEGGWLDPAELFEDPLSASTELRVSSGRGVPTSRDVTEFFRLPPDQPLTLTGAAPGTYHWQAQLPLDGPALNEGWRLRSSVVRGSLDTHSESRFVARIVVDRVLRTELNLTLPQGAEATWVRVFARDSRSGLQSNWDLTPSADGASFTGALLLPEGTHALIARAWSPDSPIGYTWSEDEFASGRGLVQARLTPGRTLTTRLASLELGSVEGLVVGVGVTEWGADSAPIASQLLVADGQLSVPGLPMGRDVSLRLPKQLTVAAP